MTSSYHTNNFPVHVLQIIVMDSSADEKDNWQPVEVERNQESDAKIDDQIVNDTYEKTSSTNGHEDSTTGFFILT